MPWLDNLLKRFGLCVEREENCKVCAGTFTIGERTFVGAGFTR